MVIVALAGLACRGTSLYQRRQKYLDWADSFRMNEATYATTLAEGHPRECSQGRVGLSPEELAAQDAIEQEASRRWDAEDRAYLRHFRMLREKYELAARYPWLPVEPDPPEPE